MKKIKLNLTTKIMKYIPIILISILSVYTIPATAQQCDHSEMSEDLEEAYLEDQDIRREIMPVIAEYQESGKGAFKLLRLKWKMDRIDSRNQELLDEWMETCGWPDELTPGAHRAVFMVLQHSELEPMKQNIDEVQHKVDKGLLDPDDHATMSDRIAMYEGRAQRFGTQTFQTADSENTVWPVVNADSLNIWRANVGLPPMEEYFAIAQDSMGVRMVMNPTLTLEDAKRIRSK